MSQNVDDRIIKFTNYYKLVGEGVTQVRKMEHHIKIFVKDELFRGEQLPPITSRRFFPIRNDIRSHMYHATVQNRLAKLDQQNLDLKIKQWRIQSPNDSFFFRGYGEVVDDECNEKEPNEKIADEVKVCKVRFISGLLSLLS